MRIDTKLDFTPLRETIRRSETPRRRSIFGLSISVLVGMVAFWATFEGADRINKLMLVLLVPTIMSAILGGRSLQFRLVDLFLGLFVTLAVVTTSVTTTIGWSESPLLFSYLGVAAAFYVVSGVAVGAAEWKVVGFGFLMGCLFLTGYLSTEWRGDAISAWNRITYGDVNANYIGYSLATGIPIAYGLLKSSSVSDRTCRIVFSLVALTVMFGILLTGCRGALVAALATSTYGLVRDIAKRTIAVFAFLVAFTLIGILGLNLTDDSAFTSSRLLNVEGDLDQVTSGRATTWQQALSAIENRPLFGNGGGAFERVSTRGIRAHNVFLSVTVEFGLVGLVLFVGAVISSILPHFRLPSTDWRFGLAVATLLTWMPIALTGVWEYAPPAWILFGWLSGATPKGGLVRRAVEWSKHRGHVVHLDKKPHELRARK